jgi:hypothetical protein
MFPHSVLRVYFIAYSVRALVGLEQPSIPQRSIYYGG